MGRVHSGERCLQPTCPTSQGWALSTCYLGVLFVCGNGWLEVSVVEVFYGAGVFSLNCHYICDRPCKKVPKVGKNVFRVSTVFRLCVVL